MPRQTTPDEAAAAPVVTDDGSSTLYSPRYRQCYHSRRGAVSEARQVFLENSGIAGLLDSGREVRVLEVGFGSGLNFLVTADRARECGAALHHVALERALPSAEQLLALGHGRFLRHPELFERFVALRAGVDGDSECWRCEFGRIRLEVRFGDACQASLEADRYQAVYHDAFSPEVNAELWSEGFLGRLFGALAPGGKLATYTVQGAVRRRLAALGFEVEKRPGPPGGKREVLVARKPGGESRDHSQGTSGRHQGMP